MPVLRHLLPSFLRRPKATELTGSQGEASAAGVLSALPGYGPPDAGDYDTYRRMRNNPTVALAMAISKSPINAADWGWEADDDAEDRLGHMQKQIDPRRRWIVSNCLRGLEYGWQGFELVHEIIDGLLGYAKIKPLRHTLTQILVDKKTGAYMGLKQGDVILPPAKTLTYTYDWEPGNIYGRSRHENIRETCWHEEQQLSKKEASYVGMISSIIMLLQYPEGQSRDASGATVDNFVLAVALLRKMGRGESVAVPNDLVKWAEPFIRAGVSPGELRPWMPKFIEAKGSHGMEFVAQRKHKEALIFRGWLVPERAATEGTHGTKAEAETHGEVALQVAEEVHIDIAEYVNLYLIDPLLVLNYGEAARGSVRVVALPLIDEKKVIFKMLIEAATRSVAGAEFVEEHTELGTMLDGLGVPVPSPEEQAAREAARNDAKDANDPGEDGGNLPPKATPPPNPRLSRLAHSILGGGNGR